MCIVYDHTPLIVYIYIFFVYTRRTYMCIYIILAFLVLQCVSCAYLIYPHRGYYDKFEQTPGSCDLSCCATRCDTCTSTCMAQYFDNQASDTQCKRFSVAKNTLCYVHATVYQGESVTAFSGNNDVVTYDAAFPCAIGSYTNVHGATNCTMCETGKYNIGIGNTACTTCELGRVMVGVECQGCQLANYSINIRDDTCVRCPTAAYTLHGEDATCTPCPPYTSAISPATTCTLCDETSVRVGPDCVPCPPGTRAPWGSIGLDSCIYSYSAYVSHVHSVIQLEQSVYFNNASVYAHTQLTYDEPVFTNAVFNSTIRMQYAMQFPYESRFDVVIGGTTLCTVLADEKASETRREMLTLTIQRAPNAVKNVYDEGRCTVQVNAAQSVRELRCEDIEARHFTLRASLLYVYSVHLLYDDTLTAQWVYADDRDLDCMPCPEHTRRTGGSCEECFTGVLVEVDSQSRWWRDDMWAAAPEVEYFPQWTNRNRSSELGIMRYNDYDAEGNLFFSSLDTYTSDDNLLALCDFQYVTLDLDLFIAGDSC